MEHLDVTSKPAATHKDLISQGEIDVHDDFKRELRLYVLLVQMDCIFKIWLSLFKNSLSLIYTPILSV